MDLGTVTHSLVIPECLFPLLGRDLSKFHAISFKSGEKPKIQIGNLVTALTVTFPLRKKYILLQGPTLDPDKELKEILIKDVLTVWAEDNPPGLAKHVSLIIVQLISRAQG